MKRILLTLGLLTAPLLATPQYSPEQIKMVEEFIYESTSELFGVKKYFSKVNASYSAPWNTKSPYSQNEIKQALSSIEKNATAVISKGFFGKKKIRFESEFPKDMNISKEFFAIELVSSSIKNQQKNSVDFNSNGMLSFSSRSQSGIKNGKSYSHEWVTVKSDFESEENPGENLKGNATFNSQFITGYDKATITPKDIGKSFTIGDISFTVIDVKDNRVVIDTKGKSIDGLQSVNLNSKNQEITPISYEEFEKSGETSISFGDIPGDSYQSIDSEIYKAFNNNPALSLEHFRTQFHEKFITGGSEKDVTYHIFESAGPIEQFTLYRPVYGITKSLKVTVTEE